MNVTLDYGVLAPVLIPALGAVLVLLVDAVLPRLGRWHWAIAAVLLIAGAAACVPAFLSGSDARRTLCLDATQCLYVADRPGSALQIATLVSAAVVALLVLPVRSPADRTPIASALVLTAASGGAGVAAARDLGSWLVLIELATIPTVALVAFRARRSAVDGALSLLTTSLVSFAVLALGAALWFAATGSALLDGDAVLAAAADPQAKRVLVLAVVLIVAGLGFKLSLVPFHAWTPEAYAGASVPIGAFLAVTSKFAALAALLVVLRGVTVLGAPALQAIAVVAAVSMTLGNVMALRESSALRLLAWSTVAQAGWVILPLATVARGAVRAATGYLLVYGLATIVAFAVVTLVAHAEGRGRVVGLSSYAGLFRRRPLAAVTLAVALLTLAGLPPSVVGLVAKVLALRPVAADGLWWLAIVAAVNAMLGLAVYLRWMLAMAGTPAPDTVDDRPHRLHLALVVLGLLALGVTSVAPQLLLGLAG
ncbi:proton-conducting transporter membrane subunit [Luteipulveratus sp. YIM 133132]|uniref:NADH-quinone oxidoreductase subunit N n=1 Tax=Luteipulveratus flavus TaxID=3031728 RepID=UPI0023B02FF8|nr:proton-conducting transporter membrane subunit [Luteipulveratus sp. YIM 133132]MDE9365142.1 proton-conducting transporter membrane subunit [Luteipulveratus sp. YIM 133132]